MKKAELTPKSVSEILKKNQGLCLSRINRYFGPFKTSTNKKTKDGWTGSFFEKYSEKSDQECFEGGYDFPMIATISLRFREQEAITVIIGKMKEEGWSYDGFIPGPEYTTKSKSRSYNLLGTNYITGKVEKDQWFLMIFSNENAQRIPDGLRNLQLSGTADAFFKANKPVYLASRIRVYPSGESSDVVVDPLVSIRQEGRELGARLKSGEITKKEFEHEKEMILRKHGFK